MRRPRTPRRLRRRRKSRRAETLAPPTDYFNEPEAATYTRTPAGTLRNMRWRGGGPRFLRVGRSIRYRRDWCDEWMLAGAARSTSEYAD